MCHILLGERKVVTLGQDEGADQFPHVKDKAF